MGLGPAGGRARVAELLGAAWCAAIAREREVDPRGSHEHLQLDDPDGAHSELQLDSTEGAYFQWLLEADGEPPLGGRDGQDANACSLAAPDFQGAGTPSVGDAWAGLEVESPNAEMPRHQGSNGPDNPGPEVGMARNSPLLVREVQRCTERKRSAA